MEEILYLTGGNTKDKSTRQITYDEAQKMLSDAQNNKESYKPICSMIILKKGEMYRKVIYFTFQMISVDLDTTKQVWYNKVSENEYFIDKIVYHNFNKQNIYLEMHFRDRTFSDPNICMIRMQGEKDWEYYVGDIEDTLFYRTIKLGEIDSIYNDLDTSFESYLHNVQKCDKRFIRKK